MIVLCDLTKSLHHLWHWPKPSRATPLPSVVTRSTDLKHHLHGAVRVALVRWGRVGVAGKQSLLPLGVLRQCPELEGPCRPPAV